MSLKQFWILIEPRSKILSILPALMGLLFTYFYFGKVNLKLSVIYFGAAVLFDATTSSINNIMDYYKGTTEHYRHKSNLVGKNGMNPRISTIVVLVMLVVSIGLGVYLAIAAGSVGWLVLVIGAFCFGVGIFYTFGPLPLSRLPLGEFFSGVTMGILIPILAILINVDAKKFIELSLTNGVLTFRFSVVNILAAFLVCVLPTAVIAGVELANNIADFDEDLINERKTIAMYISKKTALISYRILMYVGFVSTLVAVILRVLPIYCLLLLLVLPLVIRFMNVFLRRQHKQETFQTAIIIAGVEMTAIIFGLVMEFLI